MRLFVITLAALIGMATRMQAQTFLQHIQQRTANMGTVTVVQGNDIDELVNNADVSGHKQVAAPKTAKPAAINGKPAATTGKPGKSAATATKPATTATNAHSEKPHSEKPHSEKPHSEGHNAATNGGNANNRKKEERSAKENNNTAASPTKGETEMDVPAVDMRKKMPRRSYKVNGYRVQVFAGGNSRDDKIKAQNAGNAVKKAFPSQPIYVHFYSPRWICRMGNYRTYQEANAILTQVRKMGYKQACIVSGKINVAY